MQKILVLGAGRSSSSLINYLINKAEERSWMITVADASLELAAKKIGTSKFATAITFNVNNKEQRERLISSHDLIISLMPPPFHFQVAETCVEFSKHLLTASYVSPEIASLNEKAKEKNIIILMECGLDPGIDHMSALKEIQIIKSKGGILTSFKSFTGGLIAPESDNNPWHYKITWNPRNVVLAGKGVSTFLQNKRIVELPYTDLFKNTEYISVNGFGDFEAYANRDSLKYMETYQLKGLSTFLRGTLRRPGYCSAWNALVQMGYTKDENVIIDNSDLTYRELSGFLLQEVHGSSLEEKILTFCSSEDLEKLKWLGILSDEKINLSGVFPADVLQKLLEEKWKLMHDDKDMIVMQHQFEYLINKQKRRLTSSLVVKGHDENNTAMAMTVGLPLGISAKLILEGKINLRGVYIPVNTEIYEPVLKELEEYGVKFENEDFIIES